MANYNRRNFIGCCAVTGAALLLPDFLKGVSPNEKIFVLIHLSGGNDGLNTVVPLSNDSYYQLRPTLALKKNEVIRLDDELYLNKNLSCFASLYEAGEAVVLNSVGFPHQSKSHFDSLSSWHSTDGNNGKTVTGWVGRLLDGNRSIQAIDMSNSAGKLMKGKNRKGESPSHLQSDDFIFQVNSVAELINSNYRFQVYHLSLTGFDTHSHQKEVQNKLLKILDNGIKILSGNLKSSGKWKDTLMMTYSEFGRSMEENMFGGTEHGNANTVLLAGGNLKPTVMFNKYPVGKSRDYEIDFRSVYATILNNWLKVDSSSTLNGNFPLMDFI